MRTRGACGWMAALWLIAGMAFADPVGMVIALEGAASAEREGSKKNLSMQSAIYLGDRVVTESGAKLQILFDDDSLAALGENSQLWIDEYVFNPDKPTASSFAARLGRGLFRIITGKITDLHPDGFKVETGRSSVGIRGCELSFSIGETSDQIFLVRIPEGREILIKAGSWPVGSKASEAVGFKSFPRAGRLVTVFDTGRIEVRPIPLGEERRLYESTNPSMQQDREEEDGQPADSYTPASLPAERMTFTVADQSSTESGRTAPETPLTPSTENALQEETLERSGDVRGVDDASPRNDESSGDDESEGLPSSIPDTSVDTEPQPGPAIPPDQDFAPEPEPTPDPEPEPTPDPEPEPTPDPEPDPTPDPEPDPTPDPEPDPTPDPEPDPTPSVVGYGLGGTYTLETTGEQLSEASIYRIEQGVFSGALFSGVLVGDRYNSTDGFVETSQESLEGIVLPVSTPGQAYTGYQEIQQGSVRVAADNLGEFARQIDDQDSNRRLLYWGVETESFMSGAPEPDEVRTYEVSVVDMRELNLSGALGAGASPATLYFNTRTRAWGLRSEQRDLSIYGPTEALDLFGREAQGIGSMKTTDPSSFSEFTVGGFAGFLVADATEPAPVGTASWNGYATGFSEVDTASAIQFVASGVGSTDDPALNEDRVSVTLHRDAPLNSVEAQMSLFEAPPASPSFDLVQDPQISTLPDVDVRALEQGLYVRDDYFEATGSESVDGSRTRVMALGGGENWTWGEWNKSVEPVPGAETDTLAYRQKGGFVVGDTLSPEDFSSLVEGAQGYFLQTPSDRLGVAQGVVGGGGLLPVRLQGTSVLMIDIPGMGSAPTWSGTFGLSGEAGNSLQLEVYSGGITQNGHLQGQADFYTLNLAGATSLDASSLIRNELTGNLVGPGNGSTPVTGAIGQGVFTHQNGVEVRFTYGTDLYQP